MIEIEEPGWDAPEQDNCGSMTYAVLKIDSISIPLCSDCLKDLEQSLNEYKSNNNSQATESIGFLSFDILKFSEKSFSWWEI